MPRRGRACPELAEGFLVALGMTGVDTSLVELQRLRADASDNERFRLSFGPHLCYLDYIDLYYLCPRKPSLSVIVASGAVVAAVETAEWVSLRAGSRHSVTREIPQAAHDTKSGPLCCNRGIR